MLDTFHFRTQQQYTMTKEAILNKYPSVENNRASFQTFKSDVEKTMDEYAKQQCIVFAKWVMNNCIQDLGDSDDNRWAYFPQNDVGCMAHTELTDIELYNQFITETSI